MSSSKIGKKEEANHGSVDQKACTAVNCSGEDHDQKHLREEMACLHILGHSTLRKAKIGTQRKNLEMEI